MSHPPRKASPGLRPAACAALLAHLWLLCGAWLPPRAPMATPVASNAPHPNRGSAGGLEPVPLDLNLSGPEPTQPFDLILQADLVVEGVIADTGTPGTPGRTVLELELGEIYHGFVPGGGERIEVAALDGDGREHRYARYERGQRAVFLLRRPPPTDPDGPWTQLGNRDEGEWPLIRYPSGSQQVLFRGAGLERLAPVSSRAFGHHYYGFRRPLGEFRELVRVLRHCFEWEPVRSHLNPDPLFRAGDLRLTCSEGELAELVATSALASAVLEGSDARSAMLPAAGS